MGAPLLGLAKSIYYCSRNNVVCQHASPTKFRDLENLNTFNFKENIHAIFVENRTTLGNDIKEDIKITK